jgi:hypothetical protein
MAANEVHWYLCAEFIFRPAASSPNRRDRARFVLCYGLVEPNGDAQIQIFYDHRIMDGFEVFRLVREVEATLNPDLAAEVNEGLQPAIGPAARWKQLNRGSAQRLQRCAPRRR